MMIIFKLVGGYFGLRIAMFFGANGLAGAIVGAIIGHSLDIILSAKISNARAQRYWKAKAGEQYQQIFTGTVFGMLGKLCSVDGEVSTQELNAVEEIITDTLKFGRRQRKDALQVFKTARSGRAGGTTFQFDSAQYYEVHQGDRSSLENFILIMFRVASADGKVNEMEERMIRSAANVFNISDDRYYELSRNYLAARGSSSSSKNGKQASLSGYDDPYSVLGCSRNDPEKVIKQNYRKLVSDFHPDKIVSKNLPEEFTQFAADKFKTIQEAYELVKSERKFS